MPFFKALAFHQTKEWFEANRAIYEGDIKRPLGDLVEDLAAVSPRPSPAQGRPQDFALPHQSRRALRQGQEPLQDQRRRGADAQRGKNDPGLIYVHVAGDGCFAAAGFYQPEPEELARLRAAIVRAPKAWRAMAAEARQGRLTLADEYAMKRAPRGFEDIADPDIAAAVRNKSFICSRADRRRAARTPALVDDIVAFARDALPLLEWGWSAVVDRIARS